MAIKYSAVALVFLSVVSNASARSFFQQVGCTVAGKCKSKPSPRHLTNAERWPAQSPTFNHPSAIMVGDSIVAGWVPGPIPVMNHAIGGQTLAQISEYYNEDLQDYRPSAAIIEGGTNDLKAGASPDQVIGQFVSLVSRSIQNGIKVFVVNIIPHSPTGSCSDAGSGWLNVSDGNRAYINNFLANFCADKSRCTLVDAAGKFGATYNPSFYQDCAHPGTLGYALMDQALMEAL